MSTKPPATRRNTSQLDAVRAAMAQSVEFRTAQDVHELLRHQGGNVGLATVYRRLQAMAKAGEVDTVRTPDGVLAYRSCQAVGHHHHLICRQCGKAQEIALPGVEQLLDAVAAEHGFRALDHEVELFGDCADCASIPD